MNLPPGAANDPNAPYNQEDYSHETWDELFLNDDMRVIFDGNGRIKELYVYSPVLKDLVKLDVEFTTKNDPVLISMAKDEVDDFLSRISRGRSKYWGIFNDVFGKY